MVRKYKKRTYKPRKRTYKRRYYKRRYYKRRYKPIKKPEIHILENNITETAFNDTTYGMGIFNNLTLIDQVQSETNYDDLVYRIRNKPIEGKKIRLKYLYIKGYIKITGNSATTSNTQTGGMNIYDSSDDNFNCKLMVFRWKRNTSNYQMDWSGLVNNPPSGAVSSWTDINRLDMLYKQDWKNDIKINFYKKVKNLYRKYDNVNNVIPFKMRVPLYDCVLTCDNHLQSSDNKYVAYSNPSTNGLYFTFLSSNYDANTSISYKYKLYYTDY